MVLVETAECQGSSVPLISSREEVEATKNYVLETFYPQPPPPPPTDLQECNVYDVEDGTGCWEGYPYPYLHILHFLEKASLQPHSFQPDQL